MGKNIIFLSAISQANLNNEFVDAMPWFSFGRKNIGYLYAIANGAKTIWDFDDDNLLKVLKAKLHGKRQCKIRKPREMLGQKEKSESGYNLIHLSLRSPSSINSTIHSD